MKKQKKTEPGKQKQAEESWKNINFKFIACAHRRRSRFYLLVKDFRLRTRREGKKCFQFLLKWRHQMGMFVVC